ncbi:MAG TPA: hypothetical protein VK968_04790 [Roseimicrobium sp.]|nr:hypothetical protein [Roseimicrobium sp.]
MSGRKILSLLVVPLVVASGLLYLAGREPRWLPAGLLALSGCLLVLAMLSRSPKG